jgi:hypothetical protein
MEIETDGHRGSFPIPIRWVGMWEWRWQIPLLPYTSYDYRG